MRLYLFSYVGGSLIFLLCSSAGCPGSDPAEGCAKLPGCPSGPCCSATSLCLEKVCEGKAWTCKRGSDGKFFWDTNRCPPGDYPIGPGPDIAPGDGPRPENPAGDVRRADRAPVDKSCACAPGSSKPCGPCNLGKFYCKSDCSGYDESSCKNLPADTCTSGQTRPCGNCNKGNQTCNNCAWGTCNETVCAPGSKQQCPNGCGDRTCDGSCNYGSCSLNGVAVKKTGLLCWSANHCGTGNGRCVDCWYVCDANGNLFVDNWCAGSNCQTCSPANPNC